MQLPAAEIIHRTPVSNTMINEANIEISSIEYNPNKPEMNWFYKIPLIGPNLRHYHGKQSLERVKFRSGNGSDHVWKYINPLLTFYLKAYVSAWDEAIYPTPGCDLVTSFSGRDPMMRHGFDSDSGVIVYDDPTTSELIDSDLPEVSFTAVHGPFIA